MLGYARVLNQARGDLVENPLSIGDLVRLRSGGPVMAVEGFDDLGRAQLVWASKGGEVQREALSPHLLRRDAGFFGRRR